jgi:hypothetical protein
MPSKFGLIETADVALTGGGRTASCTAWRMVAADVPLRLFGWLCAGEDRPPRPAAQPDARNVDATRTATTGRRIGSEDTA